MSKREKGKIAVIGGGVAGASISLYLGRLGLDVTLFEKSPSLVGGPPFCHLHAGGNLYPDISNAQCITLLKQSIDFLRYYPFIVDYRPTVIVLPTTESSYPLDLLPRLDILKEEYQTLIKADPANNVLGEPENYYQRYDQETMQALRNDTLPKAPRQSDKWMIPVAKNIDFSKVQFPLILVQEYGLNLFRLSSALSLSLEKIENLSIHTQTIVHNIHASHNDEGWIVNYLKEEQSHQTQFDYLINATGFRTGKIDDMLGAPCKTMVEFKAAYVSQWKDASDTRFPEIIFHGKRGTPQGMGQFTPYPEGYFQLHGMTHDITLYEEGLVANTAVSCQAKLGPDFMDKITHDWKEEETHKRTKNAIEHLSQYLPRFSVATVGSRPLFGAQQIPGDDPTLRVAEVSFPRARYARCEIVKVSSVLDMIDAIMKDLHTLGYVEASMLGSRDICYIDLLDEKEIQERAQNIAQARNYPSALANRTVPLPLD